MKLTSKSLKQSFIEFFEENTLRCEISYRGGGIEIDVSEIFGENCKISAYQNYLGGGIAGKICSDYNFKCSGNKIKLLERFRGELVKYFYDLNNGGGDEYMQEEFNSFDRNQELPESSY